MIAAPSLAAVHETKRRSACALSTRRARSEHSYSAAPRSRSAPSPLKGGGLGWGSHDRRAGACSPHPPSPHPPSPEGGLRRTRGGLRRTGGAKRNAGLVDTRDPSPRISPVLHPGYAWQSERECVEYQAAGEQPAQDQSEQSRNPPLAHGRPPAFRPLVGRAGRRVQRAAAAGPHVLPRGLGADGREIFKVSR